MVAAEVKLVVSRDSLVGIEQCLRSLQQAIDLGLETSVLEGFPQLLDRALDGSINLVSGFADALLGRANLYVARGAVGAVLGFQPSELFREFVAAIARDVNVEVIEVHGWPVLSFVSRIPNVTDAGVAEKHPGGGSPSILTEGRA